MIAFNKKFKDKEANARCYVDAALAVLSNMFFFNGSLLNLHKGLNLGWKFYIAFYSVFYFENSILIGMWGYYTEDKTEWFYYPSFAAFGVGAVFHITLFRLYYHVRKMASTTTVVPLEQKPQSDRA